MKVSIISLGCDKATVDSERIVGDLVGRGARLVTDHESADLILVNTCGFIDPAKRESIETILQAAALKESAGVRAVVAVGCLVERYRRDLEKAMPEVDLFLGLNDIDLLATKLESLGLATDPTSAHPGVRQYLGESPHIRYLKISEGCDHSCSFCAIPLIRGKFRSEPIDRLVAEAQLLEREGAKEITLVAQDVGHYGRDLGPGGTRLPDLLKALLSATSVPWYRLLYVYPLGLGEDLVGMMAAEPRLVPYIDIPIQHASDSMLERMRRPERQATIREKVALLRDAIPDMVIRTTVVLGFPGETERDFQILKDFIEDVEFERLGTFTYSPQDGTASALMPDDVPDEIKLARQEELQEIQRLITEDRFARFVGREAEVLVDGAADAPEGGYTHLGRVQWQADDVDGVTYLSNGGSVNSGEFCRVVIEDNQDYDFYARVLP
jgi:ribosomal protein S12 methylthiotransferase